MFRLILILKEKYRDRLDEDRLFLSCGWWHVMDR